MDRYFRLYLTGVLIAFTLIFSIAIGWIDYNQGQKQIHENHEIEIEMIGNEVVQSLHTVEQVYNLMDAIIGEEMEENAVRLLDMYEKNPVFEDWDYKEIQAEFGMDVHIIDEKNTVIHSSSQQDIGLDFTVCCTSFAKELDKIRRSGKFQHDNIDLQRTTGEIKKFGYISTPDEQYILELSMSLKDDLVLEKFNYKEKIQQFKDDYAPIHSIRIYNPMGIALGYTGKSKELVEVSEDMQPIFEEVLRTGELREVTREDDNGIQVTHRYIPYSASQDQNGAMIRIVEIVYSEINLDSLLKFYRDSFFGQQILIVFLIVVLAIIIGKVLSKPIHLAFHDSLTGLKNRAAFDIEGNRRLKRKREHVTLIMIDIDNFKSVNDKLGHLKGDQLLIDIAQTIEANTRKQDTVARIGGDEIVILCSNVEQEAQKKLVKQLLCKLREVYKDLNDIHHLKVSVSAGIADAYAGEDLKSLYDRADKALYCAKEQGKNQYQFYEH